MDKYDLEIVGGKKSNKVILNLWEDKNDTECKFYTINRFDYNDNNEKNKTKYLSYEDLIDLSDMLNDMLRIPKNKNIFYPSKTIKSNYECIIHKTRVMELGFNTFYCKECQGIISISQIKLINKKNKIKICDECGWDYHFPYNSINKNQGVCDKPNCDSTKFKEYKNLNQYNRLKVKKNE